MEKKSTLSIALSQEELYVVLAYLKLPRILGLDLSRFAELPEDNLAMILGVAERGLISRGFLEANKQGQLELIPVVQAMIGACASPQKTLIIKTTYPHLPAEELYYHVSRKMHIIHMVPMTGVHQFIMVKDQTALLHSAYFSIKLTQQYSEAQLSALLIDDDIALARKAGSTDDAARILNSKYQLDSMFSLAFSQSLVNPVQNILVLYVRQDAYDQGSVSGFTILEGENHLWLLTPKEDGNVYISSINPLILKGSITELFNQ
ncbi:MAG TPA: hypothetical protein PLS77_14010 [Anaerolineaceae bacterium]|nr:hypothetical protein [Anaerolineaceae bacterium]HQF46832.1 hypothetical protein [Anaerolineaceae bacterium]HQH36811.1 hypothetical protein [Anaerolineaceae bacterium]HQP62321.1 hypothetical protein [Anaerolineaceae bacterium]